MLKFYQNNQKRGSKISRGENVYDRDFHGRGLTLFLGGARLAAGWASEFSGSSAGIVMFVLCEVTIKRYSRYLGCQKGVMK